MKKYTIYYKQSEIFFVNIKAKSKKEAIKKAESLEIDEFRETGDMSFHYDSITINN